MWPGLRLPLAPFLADPLELFTPAPFHPAFSATFRCFFAGNPKNFIAAALLQRQLWIFWRYVMFDV